jgi:hypothetical protein
MIIYKKKDNKKLGELKDNSISVSPGLKLKVNPTIIKRYLSVYLILLKG